MDNVIFHTKRQNFIQDLAVFWTPPFPKKENGNVLFSSIIHNLSNVN